MGGLGEGSAGTPVGGVAGQDLGIGELLGREPEPRAAGADRLPPRCGLRALGARSRPRNVLSPARRGGGEELGLAGGAARSGGGGGGGTGGGRGRELLRPLTAPSCGPPPAPAGGGRGSDGGKAPLGGI